MPDYKKWTHVVSTPEKDDTYAYFLGLLIGDGCLNHSHSYHITYTSIDRELAEAFYNIGKRIFGHEGAISERANHEWNRVITVRFCSQMMYHILYDETAGKTTIPSWIVNGSDKIMSSFIRGFADAEGSVIDTNSANIIIAQKERGILLVIQYMLHKLGIFSRVVVANSNGVYCVKICNHPDVQRYMDVVGFGLERKRVRAMQLLSRRKMSSYGYNGVRAIKRRNDLMLQREEWKTVLGVPVDA